MAAPSPLALTKPLGQKLMQDVSNAYPDFDGQAFPARAEWNKKLGASVRTINVANYHLNIRSGTPRR